MASWDVMTATDFFSIDIWIPLGLTACWPLFLIDTA